MTAIGTSPVLSTIQASPTTFEFTEPVYLQPWTRYAIVVQSQSTEYELFSAKTLERVFGSTTRTITTQPIPGELFLPANGGNYVGSKDQDLMYRLIRAKFDQGGGSLVLKNALMLKELEPNSIHTSNGSTTVTIKHPQHGHKVGDTVNVAGAVATNGVPASEINQNQTITAVSLNQYQFAVSTSATATGFGGGDEVRATENHVFSVANLQLENVYHDRLQSMCLRSLLRVHILVLVQLDLLWTHSIVGSRPDRTSTSKFLVRYITQLRKHLDWVQETDLRVSRWI